MINPLIAVRAFLGGIPWQLWVVAALLALLPITYCKGKSDGKQAIIARLEKAEVKAKEKAKIAATNADAKQTDATEKFEAQQEALGKVIKDAKATDSNPLDALLGSMP